MPSVWDTVTVFDASSLRPAGDDGVVLYAGQRYTELPESGWSGLVGRLAGAPRLLSCSDDLSAHVTETTTQRGPVVFTAVTQRSADEQALVDEDINAYLDAASAEPRLPGRRWFVLLPDGISAEEFWEAMNEAATQAPPHPSAPLRCCAA